jgi:hypothetical protein
MNNYRIDSPLSNFNNFILQIGNELNDIYYPDEKSAINTLLFKNQLLFENQSLLLFGFIKIYYKNGECVMRLFGEINPAKNKFLKITVDNFPKIILSLNKYLYMLSRITENFDTSVNQKYIDTIYETLVNTNIKKIQQTKDISFLIPFKNKIKHLFDSDSTLNNLFSRFEYIISFHKKLSYQYTIYRVLSSDLDENKSLENIRYLEKESIKQGIIEPINLSNFLTQLFYYGELV